MGVLGPSWECGRHLGAGTWGWDEALAVPRVVGLGAGGQSGGSGVRLPELAWLLLAFLFRAQRLLQVLFEKRSLPGWGVCHPFPTLLEMSRDQLWDPGCDPCDLGLMMPIWLLCRHWCEKVHRRCQERSPRTCGPGV